MVGAFIADWREEPGDLIMEVAKIYKAKRIVTGKSNRVKLPTAHSVSDYISKYKNFTCSLLFYEIPEGWKSGEPTNVARSHSDSQEPKPTSPSPRRHMLSESARGQMLSETSQSNRRPLPLTSPEAVASTQLLKSPRTQPPKRLSPRSTPDADSKRRQFPPPPQKSASAEVSTIKLCSSVSPRSQLELKKIESAIAEGPVDPAEAISQLEPSGVLLVSSKSQLEPSKIESDIPQCPLDPVEGEFVAARSHLETSQVPSIFSESHLEPSQMPSISPESQLEPSEMPSVSPESQLEQGKVESGI